MRRIAGILPTLLLAATAAVAGPEAVLRKPFGMDVDPAGTLYVADVDANHIAVFDNGLQPVKMIDQIQGYGRLTKPFDIKRSGDGGFWIIDNGKSNVILADREWKLVRKIGSDMPGSAPGEFSDPHALAVAPDGSIFVADTFNSRVQRFDADGNFISAIRGTKVGGEFPISSPVGVAVLGEDALVVTDYGDQPPVIADFRGTVLRKLESFGMAYGASVRKDRIAIVWTYSDVVSIHHRDGRTLFTIRQGGDAQPFNKPGGAIFAPDGRIIVNEWRARRLGVFDFEGKHLKSVGGHVPAIGGKYEKNQRHLAERPIVFSAFTRVLSPEAVAQYHEAGVNKLYFQSLDDIHSASLRQAVEAAHALGMKADFVFDAYMHGTREAIDRPGPFAREHPQYFTRKRDGVTVEQGMLSYVYPEVRQWKVREVVAALTASGADGVVLDYIRWPAGNTDGYDPPALKRFEQMYGEDARKVDPMDPRWVALRSSYITQFLSELRTEIDRMDRPVTVGVYVDANPEEEMRSVGRNWPVWSRLGLIDATHHMLYTDDFDQLYKDVRRSVELTGPGTWVASCIDVYAGFLSTPELMREGARVSAMAGANEVVIVRDGKIEQLDLFGAMRQAADDLGAKVGSR